jgi:hemolysin activation/secretion protein
MGWCLKLRGVWCGAFVQNVALIACISPSFATPPSVLLGDTLVSSTRIEVAQNPPPVANPQPDPNQDRFLQPGPIPSPAPVDDVPITSPQPSPESNPTQPSQTVLVKRIEVTGSTIFGSGEIDPIIKPLEGRSVTLETLRDAVATISELYRKAGYLTSRAVLDEAMLPTGDVKIRVIEGGLEEIRVEGTRRLNPGYVRERIQLGAKQPLNATKLEAQLRLLKADPLFEDVEASLRAGTKVGQSILTVRVTEANPLGFNFGLDNYSPPSIAPERASASARYSNLTGLGDELSAAYAVGTNLGDFSEAALNIYSFSYRVPLNPMNGTLQFRTDIINSKITDPEFAALGIEGESEFYELSFRQPITRTLREELALSIGFAVQGGLTLIGDTPFPVDGVSRNRVLAFGQDYTRRDGQGAWVGRSQFNFGLGILDALEQGKFFIWLGQAQRLQQLGNDNLLILQGNVQLTPDNLPPFYRFVIGGGQSVRGYRQNARSGDNGFRLSVEGRFPILRNQPGAADLQLAPFVDVGQIWGGGDNSDNPLLASVGLGLLWQPVPRLNIRIDYGIPLVDIETAGSHSLQDDGFHFSLNYTP